MSAWTLCGNVYGVAVSQTELEERKASGQAPEWEAYRTDRATKTQHYNDKFVNVGEAHADVSKDENIESAFGEGIFYVSGKFGSTRILQFHSQAELVKYIETTIGFQTGIGETGEFGVFVSMVAPGGSYRYKRGVRHSKGHEKREEFEDSGTARARFLSRSKADVALLFPSPDRAPRPALAMASTTRAPSRCQLEAGASMASLPDWDVGSDRGGSPSRMSVTSGGHDSAASAPLMGSPSPAKPQPKDLPASLKRAAKAKSTKLDGV